MRSVVVHLKTADADALRTFLHDNFPSQSDPWIYWVDEDPCLYIRFYTEALAEFSKEEQAAIRQNFGSLPSVSLIADVSGRHSGHREVRDFISLILGAFEGLAQDDYSEHFWTLGEVLSEWVTMSDGSERGFFYHLAL